MNQKITIDNFIQPFKAGSAKENNDDRFQTY
jgi:hypothetical protein